MNIPKETKWLCENASRLEKFAGQWVAFSVREGVVRSGAAFEQVFISGRSKKSQSAPFVFHVPSRDELSSPIPLVKKA